MNKPLVIGSVILGVLFIICGLVYFLEPANALPSFFPGYNAALSKHHVTHGTACLILGIGCFIFAWFQSGKKSAKKEE